ncbi:MAG: GTP-binding protein, partial [Erysipelotrichaceae bacterium]|nr:GTP-binding protein [Erysipelotrichaceae bacterium]
MINVYIVSGFLGAGKTTFIQKLLSEKKFEKVMLLENEFGEVGVDGAFFDKSLKIKEINNGCICCSLQGDFEDALEEIEDMGVTDLLIEPSGVGKLSEIINVVKADPDFRIVSHICIVDVKTCRKYHVNFKEYFNDQVAAANAVILSHTDVADAETIEKAKQIVRELNEDAEIVEEPIADLPIDEVLDIIVSGGDILPEFEEEEHEHEHHHHHHDDEDEEHEHHHHDDDEEEDEEHHHHHH